MKKITIFSHLHHQPNHKTPNQGKPSKKIVQIFTTNKFFPKKEKIKL